MEEFDDPITLELQTEREVAVLFFALGAGAGLLLEDSRVSGAQAASNLQIRTAKTDRQRVVDSLNEYGDGGLMNGHGEVSPEAAVARLADEGETDPDDVTKGML